MVPVVTHSSCILRRLTGCDPLGSLVTLLEIARLISARRRGGTKLDPWRHNTNPSAALGHFRLSLLLVTGGSCGSTQLRTAAVAALANTSCSLLQPSRHVQLLQTQLLVKLLSGGSHCSARREGGVPI